MTCRGVPLFTSIPQTAVSVLIAFASLLFVDTAHAQPAAGPSATPTTKDTPPGEWQTLFDGKTLNGWAQSGFEGEGDVKVENPFRGGPGAIVVEAGTTLSGITWTRGAALPRTNYEITLEAMKLKGGDFFCGLTFPVGK